RRESGGRQIVINVVSHKRATGMHLCGKCRKARRNFFSPSPVFLYNPASRSAHMTTLSRNARVAGLLYLTLVIAPLRLIYIPSKLIVSGNAAATAGNIAAHQTLFRLGILTDLFTG